MKKIKTIMLLTMFVSSAAFATVMANPKAVLSLQIKKYPVNQAKLYYAVESAMQNIGYSISNIDKKHSRILVKSLRKTSSYESDDTEYDSSTKKSYTVTTIVYTTTFKIINITIAPISRKESRAQIDIVNRTIISPENYRLNQYDYKRSLNKSDYLTIFNAIKEALRG